MMKSLQIPYGRGSLKVRIPSEKLKAVLESTVHELPKADIDQQRAHVLEALSNPTDSIPLEQLAIDRKRALIITSDHTRPVPSKITMPLLLRSMRSQNPGIEVTILVATGYHRATSEAELREKFGDEIVETETITVHDAFDQSSLVNAGLLPSGGELWINRLALETDLLVAEGFIEPHFFAGYSGGRKSVLPGIAGAQTVLANHCSEFIASPHARTGILENNPIHRDMIFAAQTAKLAFILNVVLNQSKEVVHAVAGHFNTAHLAGCDFLRQLASVRHAEADIVITSNGGYPLDQNIYQAVKGMTAAEACCRPGGTIIMVATCEDGHGGQSFFETMSRAKSPSKVLEMVAGIPSDKTMPDQWEFQILARILDKYRVVLVTDQCDHAMIRAMHMEACFPLQEALENTIASQGNDAEIVVIPDGVGVIVE